MAEHRARQLQFAVMASASAPRDSGRIAARRPRDDSRFRLRAGLRPRSRRDSLLRPPRCASAVVVGIPMGRNRARDARDAQLLLADDQRSRLLRQAARLVLARNFFDTVHRRPQRGCNAPALRDRGTARSGATDASRATPLRRSHRDTLRRHPRDQLQLRILFAPRERRRRNDHRRTRRTAAVQSQRRARRRNLGRRPVADHGGDIAHQRPARIRAAAVGDRRVLMPARRLGAVFSGNLPAARSPIAYDGSSSAIDGSSTGTPSPASRWAAWCTTCRSKSRRA